MNLGIKIDKDKEKKSGTYVRKQCFPSIVVDCVDNTETLDALNEMTPS